MAEPNVKKMKLSDVDDTMEDDSSSVVNQRLVQCQLVSETGEKTGEPFNLPVQVTTKQLQTILNKALEKDETTPYSFFVGEKEMTDKLEEALDENQMGLEGVQEIIYKPQAVFRVRAVTRCTSTIDAHAEAVLTIQFSPDARYLASGSGDKTVRFWDLMTETPQFKSAGHKHHVLTVAWSPDGKKLASGCRSGMLIVWDPKTGKSMGKPMVKLNPTRKADKQGIVDIAWKPMHLDPECVHLVTATRDNSVRIWNTRTQINNLTIGGHIQPLTAVKWGGTGLIYSVSRDCTIKVWEADTGKLCRTLGGQAKTGDVLASSHSGSHGHWVNTMSLSTDYALRTGAYDPAAATAVPQESTLSLEELQKKAQEIYDRAKGDGPERLATGSDDWMVCLWTPATDKKPIQRMKGHMQTVNQVLFSPDARIIASASFDKSIKLWDGMTGNFITTLRGHVSRVLRICWSADSRLLVSGSSDTTLKLWNVGGNKKMMHDLPGHADEVYALDWSPDGQRVASGGRDKVLKIWRN